MDYSKLSHDELIEKCKELNLDYLTKAKKPKAIKTLISLLNTKKTIEPKNTYEENYLSLESIIDKCHNFLYSKGITGSKAQNDIMKFFTMKIINHLVINDNEYITSLIDNYKKTNVALKLFYDNYEGDISKVEENKINTIQRYLYYLEYLKDISLIFTKKINNIDDNDVWKSFVQECLSKIFPDIYSNDDYILNCKAKFIVRDLISIISKFTINNSVIDELQSFNGDIHEKFLKYQGNKNSKELGQFFTPREIIKTILNDCGFKNLIENLESDDLSIYDPCLGTGGLLCYTQNSCKTKIKPENIYGCEIESDTMKLGIVSLMISTNNCNKNIKRCNSLIENPYLFQDKKFDIIFTNPPFGTKTNYKQLEEGFNDFKKNYYPKSTLEFKDIYKISGNIGINLFIQNIIYLLKDNGIACIILPDGELMIGKSSLNIRKFILNNCQILKIITINSGAFANTNIKTKALLIKKINNDNYNQDIEYIDVNSNGINHLGFEKLNENYQFTKIIEEEEIKYSDDIEIKTLGEVLKLNGCGKTNTKDITNTGEYQFYSASHNNPTGTHNKYSFDGNEYLLIIKSGGCASNPISLNYGIGKVFIVKGKCAANIAVFQLIPITNNILKYLYYYLIYNQLNIQKLAKYCTNNGNIDMNELMSLKIPIPPMEKQELYVEYLDNINEITNDNKNKIDKYKRINEINLKIQLGLNKVEIKTLGEICEIQNGNYNSNDMDNNGYIPFYSCIANNPAGFHSKETFDYQEYLLIVASGGSQKNIVGDNVGLGKNYYVTGKTACRSNVYALILKIDNVSIKYLHYYLNLNRIKINNKAKFTTNLGVISKTDLSNMKIPIPSLEVQNKIVENLDYNNEIIRNLEKEIELNKMKAEEFFKQIL
jgi:type I restriction enzyme S subunit